MKTILLLLLMVVRACDVSGEMFTALVDLEQLLHGERQVALHLRQFVDEQTQRLRLLLLLADDFERHSNESLSDPERYLGNPVNAYLLIKRFTADWEQLVNTQIRAASAEEFMAGLATRTTAFPASEDLAGAAEALLRLQDTYALDTHKIASGDLMGVQDSPRLSADDCYRLGAVAYFKQDYYHTVMWITEALNIWKTEQQKTIDKPTLLDYLSYSLYMQGNVRHALKLTKEWLQLEPNHERAAGNLIYYEQTLAQQQQQQQEPCTGDEDANDEPINERPRDTYKASDEFQIYERLCRGEQTHIIPRKHQLSCRYLRHLPMFYIKPIKQELMYLNPTISMFHDVLTQSEMAAVRRLARPRLERSVVYHTGPAGSYTAQDYRISKSAWLSDWEGVQISRISDRASAVANLTLYTAEPMQVLNYGIGGHYEPHYDFSQRREMGTFEKMQGNRVATFLCYTTEVRAGGATVFPLLGVTLWPKKGSCALWYNLHRSGDGDMLTRHAACPVLSGTKWVCNKWFHERGQEFIRPCDRSSDK